MHTNGHAGLGSEIKFLVDAAVGAEIREWARRRLAPDPHGGGPAGDSYRIASLYFDTDARDVFHRRGSYGRSKYRIRRYEQEPIAFLERKLRTGDRLAKRRTRTTVGALPYLADGIPATGDPAFWFLRRLAVRHLQPVCQVSYTRSARVGEHDNSVLRLTVDEALTASAAPGFDFAPGPGVPLLSDRMIVELKFRGYLPGLFRQLVEEFAIQPRSASKYRVAADTLGLVAAHA